MSDTVRITKIDLNEVHKDHTFDSAYAVYAYLNDTPSSRWGDYFYYACYNTVDFDKRPLKLEGDKIRIVYSEGDSLQNHIDFVKSVVNAANEYNNNNQLH